MGPVGQIGLTGTNYGNQGQVLTSQGSSAAPTWQDQTGGSGGGGSPDKIFEGDTEVETIDAGTDGRIIAKTNNLERLRITSDGELIIYPTTGNNQNTSIHFNNAAHTPFIAFKSNNVTGTFALHK